MPTDVTRSDVEPRRCQDCGTVAVRRADDYGELLVCPNDDCLNIVVLAMPMRRQDQPQPAGAEPYPSPALSVVPDPEFQPAAHTDPEHVKRFVTENIGRAEREATAILAEHEPVTAQQVHALVSLAWGRGFIAGFGSGHESFVSMLEAIMGGERE